MGMSTTVGWGACNVPAVGVIGDGQEVAAASIVSLCCMYKTNRYYNEQPAHLMVDQSAVLT